MPSRLRYHRDVKAEDLRRLSAPARSRIRRAIGTGLATEPQKYGMPLRKNLKGYWKLRVGVCLAVFVVEREDVFALVICHRKDVCERAARLREVRP